MEDRRGITTKRLEWDTPCYEVFRGSGFIGMVVQHPETSKWAAPWNGIPNDLYHYHLDSQDDALDVLIAQADKFGW